MNPADIFKELVKSIAALLKAHKYKRYGGNVFYTVQQDNWGYIGSQNGIERHPSICRTAPLAYYSPSTFNAVARRYGALSIDSHVM